MNPNAVWRGPTQDKVQQRLSLLFYLLRRVFLFTLSVEDLIAGSLKVTVLQSSTQDKTAQFAHL